MTCPVCFEFPMQSPIWMCDKPDAAHSICNNCCIKLQEDGRMTMTEGAADCHGLPAACPQCRASLGHPFWPPSRKSSCKRNVTLENTMDTLLAPLECDCGKTYRYSEWNAHRAVCKHTKIRCPYNRSWIRTRMPSNTDDDGFRDNERCTCVVPMKDMWKHLMEYHRDFTLESIYYRMETTGETGEGLLKTRGGFILDMTAASTTTFNIFGTIEWNHLSPPGSGAGQPGFRRSSSFTWTSQASRDISFESRYLRGVLQDAEGGLSEGHRKSRTGDSLDMIGLGGEMVAMSLSERHGISNPCVSLLHFNNSESVVLMYMFLAPRANGAHPAARNIEAEIHYRFERFRGSEPIHFWINAHYFQSRPDYDQRNILVMTDDNNGPGLFLEDGNAVVEKVVDYHKAVHHTCKVSKYISIDRAPNDGALPIDVDPRRWSTFDISLGEMVLTALSFSATRTE